MDTKESLEVCSKKLEEVKKEIKDAMGKIIDSKTEIDRLKNFISERVEFGTKLQIEFYKLRDKVVKP